ncbi:MAG: 1-acyl-sn-glycerol-3-phosphate acyltransferase [Terriglobia bacterium]
MSPDTPPPIPAPTKPAVYRFWRGVIRLWFALTFRKIRVLHEERLKRPDPALLVVCHPESFLDALILVAGFERYVRCVIPARLIQGLLQPLMARGLGMISFLPEDRQSALEKCCVVLAEKAALVTFVEPGPAHPAGGSRLTSAAASIAVEAECRHAGGLGLKLFPVHLFLPVGHTHARELLIDIDQPETAQDYISRAGGTPHDQAQELAKLLERRCQENSFRLQPADLAEFLGDLEQALRDDFQEERAAHPAPKQKQDGFELSRFVVEWAEQMNYLHPGLLVSLRESLKAWREARRLGSLHRLEVEGAGAWLNGPVGQGIVWLESVAGFAVAFYGLLNHLVAISLLYLTGLLKKESHRDRITEWLARGLVVLGCYAVEVFLVAHFWGRRAAGYYAPTLPLSGLYLWRYAWLLRHRTRFAFLSLNLSRETAKTKRLRKDLLHEINVALDHHAEELGLPH